MSILFRYSTPALFGGPISASDSQSAYLQGGVGDTSSLSVYMHGTGNMILNGGFEQINAYWTRVDCEVDDDHYGGPYEGTYFIRRTKNAPPKSPWQDYAWQNIYIPKGETGPYIFECYLKKSSRPTYGVDGRSNARIRDESDNTVYTTPTQSEAVWTHYAAEIDVDTDEVFWEVWFSSWSAGSNWSASIGFGDSFFFAPGKFGSTPALTWGQLNDQRGSQHAHIVQDTFITDSKSAFLHGTGNMILNGDFEQQNANWTLLECHTDDEDYGNPYEGTYFMRRSQSGPPKNPWIDYAWQNVYIPKGETGTYLFECSLRRCPNPAAVDGRSNARIRDESDNTVYTSPTSPSTEWTRTVVEIEIDTDEVFWEVWFSSWSAGSNLSATRGHGDAFFLAPGKMDSTPAYMIGVVNVESSTSAFMWSGIGYDNTPAFMKGTADNWLLDGSFEESGLPDWIWEDVERDDDDGDESETGPYHGTYFVRGTSAGAPPYSPWIFYAYQNVNIATSNDQGYYIFECYLRRHPMDWGGGDIGRARARVRDEADGTVWDSGEVSTWPWIHFVTEINIDAVGDWEFWFSSYSDGNPSSSARGHGDWFQLHPGRMGSTPAFMEGVPAAYDSASAYTQGQIDYIADSQSAWLAGGIVSSDSTPAFVPSAEAVADTQSAHVAGSAPNVSTQDAYTRGQSSALGDKNAWLAGGTISADSLDAYLKGQASTTWSQDAFTQGSLNTTDSQSAYLVGSQDTTSSQDAYIGSIGDAVSSTSAFTLAEGTDVTDSQSAFVTGVSSPIDSSPAFVEGVQGYYVNDSTHAYMMSGLTEDATPAYIEGATIWPFTDDFTGTDIDPWNIAKWVAEEY